jgi:hypothetical protein
MVLLLVSNSHFDLGREIKQLKAKLLNLRVDVIIRLVVLVDHQHPACLIMPLDIRIHTNLIAIFVPSKEWVIGTRIEHVQESFDSEKQWEVVS